MPHDRATTTPVDWNWWTGSRGAYVIVRFRLVVGFVLAAHFLRHGLETVPLLERGVIEPSLLTGALSARASWLTGLSADALRMFFALAVPLTLAVACGFAARVAAAALFVMLVATNLALGPLLFIDDTVACATCLLLALAPGGSLSRRGAGRASEESGVTVTVMLAQVLILYVVADLGRLTGAPASALPVLAIATRAIAAAYLAPGRHWNLLGVGLQLAVHGYLFVTTSAFVTNLVLAATCLLFRRAAPARTTRKWRLDAGAAAALSYATLWLLATPASWLGLDSVGRGARRVLADLTLLIPARDMPPLSAQSLLLRVEREELANRAPDAASGVRTRLLIHNLASDNPAQLRLALSAPLARWSCRNGQSRPALGSVLIQSETGEHQVATFRCDAAGAMADVRAKRR